MNILYVEDDPGIGDLVKRRLRESAHEVRVLSCLAEAREALTDMQAELVICDHDLPDGTGLALITELADQQPDLPTIMLTGVGSESLAVSAMKAGARDYLVKDIESSFLDLLPQVVRRLDLEFQGQQHAKAVANANAQLLAQNRYLHSTIQRQTGSDRLIGRSDAFQQVLSVIEQVAPTDTSVLITGETGTGKEVVARLLHEHSDRSDQPLINVNCAALPEQLFESELFGHEKGAFTGAIRTHVGRFEAANGGTIFLDEVAEIPPSLQVKLLRALQEQAFERVGSSTTRSVDVRVVAATNQDLSTRIESGEFRSDLYYRLNVIPIHVPPLRHRGDDIQLLLMRFISLAVDKYSRPEPEISQDLLTQVHSYHWPGNVRELMSFAERGVVTGQWSLPSRDGQVSPTTDRLDDVIRTHILRVLEDVGGIIAGPGGAACRLGMKSNTLRSRMDKLGILNTRGDRQKGGDG